MNKLTPEDFEYTYPTPFNSLADDDSLIETKDLNIYISDNGFLYCWPKQTAIQLLGNWLRIYTEDNGWVDIVHTEMKWKP